MTGSANRVRGTCFHERPYPLTPTLSLWERERTSDAAQLNLISSPLGFPGESSLALVKRFSAHCDQTTRTGSGPASELIWIRREGLWLYRANPRSAQTLPRRPNVLVGAPVPFWSSAVTCVTIPSGEAMTVSLQMRGSSLM